MATVYLDNNATTRVAPEVLEEMRPYFCELYGNASSAHSFGGRAALKVDEAREKAAALIGARPGEIIFTSSGTESDNTAIRSALAANPEKNHILTTAVEHPAVRSLCRHLSRQGYRVTELPVSPQGELDLDRYAALLTPETAVASLMWANNETGVIFPVEQAAELAREKGVLFHTDGVQPVGKIPVNLKETAIDMLSLSGHKLHGPKGIGILFVRRGTPFKPWLIGGHQERNRRPGTENTTGIIGLGKACELAQQRLADENTRVKGLRDRLERGILENVPETRINGGAVDRLPNTANISFKGVEGESILLMLDDLEIAVSTGSACTSGSLEPSHVLLAMNIPPADAQGAIRFSLSIYNTEEEIDRVVGALPAVVERLRSMSPLWSGGKTGA